MSVAQSDGARPTLFVLVGLPGVGKTTKAQEIETAAPALRLTPDEWMIPLFGEPEADGKRDVLEGRLIATARRLLQLGVSVVLDFGVWSRDERSALRHLASGSGAYCELVYLNVPREEQHRRLAARPTEPKTTFEVTDTELDRFQQLFEPPDEAELEGQVDDKPPTGYPSWAEWCAQRWPTSMA